MQNNNWIDCLKDCKLFKDISAKNIEDFLLNSYAQRKQFIKNQIIIKTGDKINKFIIILKGKVLIQIQDENSKMKNVKLLVPNDVIFEREAMISKTCRIFLAAYTECEIVLIDPKSIFNAFEDNYKAKESLAFNYINMIDIKFGEMQKQLDYLLIKNLRARVCAYLIDIHFERNANIFMLNYNRGQLAEYLGTSRPSLSREMAWLRNEGCIDFHGVSVKILDIGKLIKLATK